MKKYAINWTPKNELIGGCEVVLDNLCKAIGINSISSTNASKILGINNIAYNRYSIIDRTKFLRDLIKILDDVEPKKKIFISNDCCNPYGTDNILVTLSQNPYITIANKLYSLGVYNFYNCYEFNECYCELQKSQYDCSDYIVACSNYMKDYVNSFGDYKNVYVIEHGVDTELFRPISEVDLRNKYNIPKDKKVGIWVGAFHPIKGYDLIHRLVNEKKDIHWILVFKHSLRSKIKSKNVSFFCNVDQKTLSELYNCADFSLQPSIVESFNLVSCEAASCGIPIIVSNTGYFYENCDENRKIGCGIVLAKTSFEDIIFAIKELENSSFKPRKYIFDNSLTLIGFNERWKNFIGMVELNGKKIRY